MFNFSQLATAVGQLLGVNTSDPTTRDGKAVRASLSLWHDALYRAYLWKDSLLEFVTPVNPATPYVVTANFMPTKGRVILPPIMGHVIGARLGCRSLNVQRAMLYYRANYGNFINSGWTQDFTLLSAAVWEFDTPQTLYVQVTNPADNNTPTTLDVLDKDETTVDRITTNATTTAAPVDTSDRIDNVIKVATQGQLFVAYPNGTRLGANLVANGATYDINLGTYSVPGLIAGQVYQITWGANDGAFTFTGGGYNSTGAGTTTTFTLPLTANGGTFSGGVGTSVTAKIQQVLPVYSPIITLQAGDLFAPKSQRMQLIGIPKSTSQSTLNLSVLGKRTPPPFAAETDIPGINGLDVILRALAYYDFKSRDEAGGTADALTALNQAVGPTFLTTGKPGGLLGKLVEEEVVQEATNTRIVPAVGFGGHSYYDEPWDATKSSPYDY